MSVTMLLPGVVSCAAMVASGVLPGVTELATGLLLLGVGLFAGGSHVGAELLPGGVLGVTELLAVALSVGPKGVA